MMIIQLDVQIEDQGPDVIVLRSDVAAFWETEETGKQLVKPVNTETETIEKCAVPAVHQLDLIGPRSRLMTSLLSGQLET